MWLEESRTGPAARQRGKIKCVVWDLDNTLWRGILT
jgi:predicted enzyme involved in methoxymalonyl-ACP biosynthesis